MTNTHDHKLKYVLFMTLVENQVWDIITSNAIEVPSGETKVSFPRDFAERSHSWGLLAHADSSFKIALDYEQAFKRFIKAGIIVRLGLGKHEEPHPKNDTYRLEVCPQDFHIIQILDRFVFEIPQDQFEVIEAVIESKSFNFLGHPKGMSAPIEEWISTNFPNLGIKSGTMRAKLFGYSPTRHHHGWGILFKHKPSKTEPAVILRCWKLFTSLDFQVKSAAKKADDPEAKTSTTNGDSTMEELEAALAEAEENIVAVTEARDIITRQIENKKAEEREKLLAESQELDQRQNEIDTRQEEIGRIIKKDDRILVVCGNSTSLELFEIKPEGKSLMKAIDFVRGQADFLKQKG